MHPETPLAIQTHQLSKTLADFSLQNVNLRIPAGVLCAVVGASGAGKSTLVKLILGLDDPDSGQRMIFGQDVALGQIQTRLRYAPQLPLLPETMTIQESLRFTTFLSGQRYIDAGTIEAALHMVNLAVPFHASVATLTPGQRQYLQLARALIGQPQLLVLDEPAGSLVGTERLELLDTLRQISSGRTLVYTTSKPNDARQVSDYLAVLHEGRLAAQGSTTAVLENADYPAYHLTVRGDATTVRDLLIEQAWIHDIRVARHGGYEDWAVQVYDEYQAERGLLRAILADRNLHVIAYEQLHPRLRDILNTIDTIHTT